jgi:hypothetical protein
MNCLITNQSGYYSVATQEDSLYTSFHPREIGEADTEYSPSNSEDAALAAVKTTRSLRNCVNAAVSDTTMSGNA